MVLLVEIDQSYFSSGKIFGANRS